MNFSTKIIRWYEKNKRDLPWRIISDPYKIWISEIILQQTRIEQGIDYYHAFLETFRDIQSLASAKEEEVLKIWQGLGYYSRARNMHKTSKIIVEEQRGIFPSDHYKLLQLPGIGEYTAAAIMSIAFKKPYSVVDGNVQRVLTRVFGIADPVDTSAGKKKINELANQLMNKSKPGIYNQAVMEFGALYCKPKNPACSNCIFINNCSAFKTNSVDELPAKKKKAVQRNRYFNYLVMVSPQKDDRSILVKKRAENDIWKNLYDFPLIETDKPITTKSIKKELLHQYKLTDVNISSSDRTYKHVLSHQLIMARFFEIKLGPGEMKKVKDSFKHVKLISLKNLKELPVPRLMEIFINESDFLKKER